MEQPVRVLIADNHPRSRNGLRALLATSAQVKVVGQATDGQEAVRLVEECQPDVVLMNAHLPVMDGLEATRCIKSRWPAVKVFMLAISCAGQANALAAGVDGLLVKGCPIEELWSAIIDSV